jgi:apolipoprotein D and lipocalin family protein
MSVMPAWVRKLAVGATLAVAAVAQIGAATAPQPTKPVDPTRYVGRWYEIARVPNSIQNKCEAQTSEWAKRSDGLFDVVQTCHVGSAAGPAKVWRGAGRSINDNGSKIRIGFFGGFVHQDYWIIDRADDYSWCIMGTPNPRYLWLMSRHAVLPPALKQALVARARALGYDTSRLVYDEQPPG